MPIIIQVALGGAIGASMRYLSGVAALRVLGAGFPYGTMFVNIVGSFLMGLAAIWLVQRGGERFAPLIMTGILGGFTTFSAFSLDAVNLMEKGRIIAATVYMGGSVALAVLALVAGMAIARMIS